MNVNALVSLVGKTEKLSGQQVRNLKKIQNISDKFHKDAGIKPVANKIAEDTIVLESGHQPNFLPHSGLFKKVFMLDFLKKRLEEKGKSCVAVFGFADYNLASAHLLYKNRVPALNRNGFKKVGFNVPKNDSWKFFNDIKRPSEEDFNKELIEIRDFYIKNAEAIKYPKNKLIKNIEVFELVMKDCYEKAKNFADMNAFFIASVCSDFGLSVNFYRYTDIQNEKIFFDEWIKIIDNIEKFNEIYNKSLRENGIDINYEENSIPFWFKCGCGGIVPLKIESYHSLRSSGICKKCHSNHSIVLDKEGLKKNFSNVSMNAVSRNIILANGLGTRIFISGAGGSLLYGRISDEISEKLKFNKSLTVTWKGMDYYIGLVHYNIIGDFLKFFKIDFGVLLEAEKLSYMIKERIDCLEDELNNLKKKKDGNKEYFKVKNYYSNTMNKISNVTSTFGLRPSFIDILLLLGFVEAAPKEWEKSFSAADMVKENGFYIARSDTIYEVPGDFAFIRKEQLAPLYDGLAALGKIADKSKEGK